MRKRILSLVLALAICLGLAAAPALAANNSPFTDVRGDAYYAKPVAWAVGQDITKGTSSATFSPDDSCSVAQILTFLWRGAGRPGATGTDMSWGEELAAVTIWAGTKGIIALNNLSTTCTRSMAVTYMWKAAGRPTPQNTVSFTDVPASADYAKAVSWALEEGITTGTGGSTFSPDLGCSRGQIVTFLYRQEVEPLTASAPSPAPTPSPTPTPTPAPTPTVTTEEQLCARVVELVNQERAKEGLSPLSTMPSLTAAANIRAPEVATLFSHTRPDGTQCFTALREANVTGYYTAGENIAAGYPTPEAVMDGWMNSSGHRANILTPEFTHIGVGYYAPGRCWVQMFIGVR